jgi:hypothetical protein
VDRLPNLARFRSPFDWNSDEVTIVVRDEAR